MFYRNRGDPELVSGWQGKKIEDLVWDDTSKIPMSFRIYFGISKIYIKYKRYVLCLYIYE